MFIALRNGTNPKAPAGRHVLWQVGNVKHERCFVTTLNLRPTHRIIRDYYKALDQFDQVGATHEGAVRSAFQSLLQGCARQFDWTLSA